MASDAPNTTPLDKQFERVTAAYIERYLVTHPEAASQLGDHRFDARSNDLSAAAFARDKQFYRQTQAQLNRIALDKLSLAHRVDYQILRDQLAGNLLSIEVIKDQEWDPLLYNPAQAIYGLLARDFAPLPQRLEAVRARLEQIPTKLAAAKANLKNPPRIHTETAIEQNVGAISLLRDELERVLKGAPEMKPKLASSRTKAIAALTQYGVWLQQDLLPRSTRDPRLGAEKFKQKLRYSLESDIAADEVLALAEADLRNTQRAMFDAALPLYHQYFSDKVNATDQQEVIRAVINKLADDRPSNENVLKFAAEDLASTAAFIREKNLLTLPNDPVKIIEMPEFQRGVAVAYCDPAGALEKNGESFFAISPAPSSWSATQTESYYREYNRSMLKNLTVHEAMPGHYVQLAIANKARVPTDIRRVVYSGIFAEGWATYAEQMMVEAGYGGAPVKIQQLKMRLRLIINAIIDHKIHAGNMTEKQAMDLMMNDGFQEEREAAGKWRRALLTSTQLSTYYVGNTEILNLRRAYEVKNGVGKLKQMHDTMLSFGTIAPKYVKELMAL